MKIAKYFLLSLIGVIAVLVAVGFFLPSRTHIERVTYIEAMPETIYGILSDLKQFDKWSPRASVDSKINYRFEGPARGLGSVMHWTSNNSEIKKTRGRL